MGEGSAKIDGVVDALRGTAEAEPGEYTVDARAARELLGRFALPNPWHYVVLVVRGLLGTGATAVDVRAKERSRTITWEGGLELDEGWGSEEVLSFALGARGAGRREIALAWFVAERLTLTPRVAGPRTLLVAGDVEPDRTEGLPEDLAILQRQARYAEVPVSIDGERVSLGLEGLGPGAFGETAIEAEGIRGRAAFLFHTPPQAEVRFLVDGIWSASAILASDTLPFVAVVAVDGLRLDASEMAPVEDDVFGRATGVCRAALEEASSGPDVAIAFGEARLDWESAALETIQRAAWRRRRMSIVLGLGSIPLTIVLAVVLGVLTGPGSKDTQQAFVLAGCLVVYLRAIVWPTVVARDRAAVLGEFPLAHPERPRALNVVRAPGPRQILARVLLLPATLIALGLVWLLYPLKPGTGGATAFVAWVMLCGLGLAYLSAVIGAVWIVIKRRRRAKSAAGDTAE